MSKVNNLCKRLKELREVKGLTQLQLAESLDIGRVSVSNYENGDRTPDADLIIMFADFFDVTTDYLLGRSEFKSFRQEYEFFRKKLGGDYSALFNPGFLSPKTSNASPGEANGLSPTLLELNTLMVSIDENYSQIIGEILLGNEKFKKPALASLDKLFNLIVNFSELSEKPYDEDLRTYLTFLNAIKRIPQLAYADFGNIQANQTHIKSCVRYLNEFMTMFTYSIFDFEKEKPNTEE